MNENNTTVNLFSQIFPVKLRMDLAPVNFKPISLRVREQFERVQDSVVLLRTMVADLNVELLDLERALQQEGTL